MLKQAQLDSYSMTRRWIVLYSSLLVCQPQEPMEILVSIPSCETAKKIIFLGDWGECYIKVVLDQAQVDTRLLRASVQGCWVLKHIFVQWRSYWTRVEPHKSSQPEAVNTKPLKCQYT